MSLRGHYGWAFSIHQKFWFEISETSLAQWNGTFRLHGPDPSLSAFCIVASQQTQNYTLKEKSKYWLYPTEHSTVEKGQWKTKGGGILYRVENL